MRTCRYPFVSPAYATAMMAVAVLLSSCSVDASRNGKPTVATRMAEYDLKVAEKRAESMKPQPVVTPVKTDKSESDFGAVTSVVKNIDLPFDDPIFPAGKGRTQFMVSCTICHSLRYVTMQPDFSRKSWEKTVDKMIKTYGAHINASEAREIVDYLVAIKSPHEKGAR